MSDIPGSETGWWFGGRGEGGDSLCGASKVPSGRESSRVAVTPSSHTWILESCPEDSAGCHMNGVSWLGSVAWKQRAWGTGLGDMYENAIPRLQSFHGQKAAEMFMESEDVPLYPPLHSRILMALSYSWKLWRQVQANTPSHLHLGEGPLRFGHGVWGQMPGDLEGHPFLWGCSVAPVFSPAFK